MQEETPQGESPSTDCGGGSMVELPISGGRHGDMRSHSRDRRSGGGTPRPVVTSARCTYETPDPVGALCDVEADDDKSTEEEQPEKAAREDRVDLRRRRTHGRLRGARGGFFPADSPLT